MRTLKNHTIIVLVLLAPVLVAFPAPAAADLVETSVNLTGLSESDVCWGDYDGDSDLDLLVQGRTAGGLQITRLYRQDSDSTFVNAQAGLPGLSDGSAEWGDYDLDGDLDLVLTGYSDANLGPLTRVYRNDAGSFVNVGFGLEGVHRGTARWGDFDQDGDLDLLVVGAQDSGVPHAAIYRKDATGFVDIGAGLTGVTQADAAWADFDGDGDLDLLLAGQDAVGDPLTRLYRNTAGSFAVLGTGIVDVRFAAIAVADLDADGDPDVAISGYDATEAKVTKVYVKDGPGFVDLGASLLGVTFGDLSFGDPDSDGDLDLLVTGMAFLPPQAQAWSILYEYDGGTYASSGAAMDWPAGGSSDWGDFDGDGFIDLAIAGTDSTDTPQTLIYRSDHSFTRTGPPRPNSIRAYADEKGITFEWPRLLGFFTGEFWFSDGHTYNVRVGTTPGDQDVVSGETVPGASTRLVSRAGNAGPNLFYRLERTGLVGSTLHWTVQGVDASRTAGALASEIELTFTEFPEAIALDGAAAGAVAWGDYDGDGDLDAATLGLDAGGTARASILRRDPGGFTDLNAGLPAVSEGDLAWGDLDRDGDLDLALVGGGQARLYRNDAGNFVELTTNLIPLERASLDWGDHDRDGDLDLVVAGFAPLTNPPKPVTRIYRNDNGTLTWEPRPLVGVDDGCVAWADFDLDADLDLLVAGADEFGNPVAILYRNDDGTFVDHAAGFTGVSEASADWGDEDADGDPDLLLAGFDAAGAPVTRLYRNQDGSFDLPFDRLLGAAGGDVAFGDHDNDGTLDWLVSGTTAAGDGVSHIYTWPVSYSPPDPAPVVLPGLESSSVAWGDSDGDGDLDLLLAGQNASGTNLARIYRNSLAAPATTPQPPTGLTATLTDGIATFFWQPAADGTDTHRTYNLRVGTTAGGGNVVSAMANAANGARHLPAPGNAGGALSFVLDLSDAAPGTYESLYWSVQAIDASYAGSAFAPEAIVGTSWPLVAALDEVFGPNATWADHDGDGDLDLAVAGSRDEGYTTRIYRQDAGTFVVEQSGLPGGVSPGVDWGDYDRDGDVDLVIAGYGADVLDPRVVVFRNDGGTLTATVGGLPNLILAAVAWGDIDSDGDLDLALSGVRISTFLPETRLYENTGGGFTYLPGSSLVGVESGTLAWADVDSDGDPDLLVAGENANELPVARLYRNDAGVLVDSGASLAGVIGGDADWGDFDQDGDPDLLLCGLSAVDQPSTRLYRNDAGTLVDANAGLEGVEFGCVVWGDHDSDGDLDALVAGATAAGVGMTRIYTNEGGSLLPVPDALPGVSYAEAAWADHDNDGDLDIALFGVDAQGVLVGQIFRNESGVANTPPAAPAGLAASQVADILTFTWDPANDPETPSAGLTYNLRVGTTPGGGDVVSPAAAASGFRRVVKTGNAGAGTSWALDATGLPTPLYWTVQAIDPAFAGSAFAAEAIFDPTASATPEFPTRYALTQNHPNPFNPSTRIAFELPRESLVRLHVFDLAGNRVRNLADGRMPAGSHALVWDGRDKSGRAVSSGVYFYRLSAEGYEATRRMMLVR